MKAFGAKDLRPQWLQEIRCPKCAQRSISRTGRNLQILECQKCGYRFLDPFVSCRKSHPFRKNRFNYCRRHVINWQKLLRRKQYSVTSAQRVRTHEKVPTFKTPSLQQSSAASTKHIGPEVYTGYKRCARCGSSKISLKSYGSYQCQSCGKNLSETTVLE